ncbi:hypothetical protein D3C81_1241460 [compost metagenome]
MRRAAGGGFQEQVVAHRLQAGRVDEVGGLQVADDLRLRVAGGGHGDGAVLADGEGLGLGGHHHGRLQGIAVGGDDLSVGVQVETAVAAVADGAVRHQHLEEATAVHCQVQRVVGGLQAAGGEVLLRADNAHAGTQLQAGRQLAVLAGLRAGLAVDLVQQVLELRTVALEAGGGDVGQVVGNGGQVHVLGGQARLADPQCRKHCRSPLAPDSWRREQVD